MSTQPSTQSQALDELRTLLAEKVTTYPGASVSEKATIRAFFKKEALRATEALDPEALMAIMQAQAQLAPAPKEDSVKESATERLARRVFALRDLAAAYASGQGTPQGIEADEVDYAELATILDGADRPTEEDESYVAEVKRLANVKATSGTKAPKGDVVAHIIEATQGLGAGTFVKVSALVKARTESYPNGASGSGAISAALFKGSTDWSEFGLRPVTDPQQGVVIEA